LIHFSPRKWQIRIITVVVTAVILGVATSTRSL
jgi:hypothetical protein